VVVVALIDSSDIAHGSTVSADVCIVGAGASGIAFAREFVDTAVDVCILEGGGVQEEPASQTLNAGRVVGLPYYALDDARWRVLGGNTGRWAGWCRPLDPIDFERRDWVPDSGWPFAASELAPYYTRAAKVVQLPETDFDPRSWADSIPAVYTAPFVGGAVEAALWQGSPPTKFGKVYGPEFEASANVRLIVHANAVELELDADGARMKTVRVASLSGREFRVAAKAFVIAAGAFDTTRLLLASTMVRDSGIGNENDLVGRHFMEHPHVTTGRLVLASPVGRPSVPAADRGIRGARQRFEMQRPKQGIKCAYRLSDDTQRNEGLLNFSAHLNTVTPTNVQDSDGYKALKLIVNNLRSARRLATQVKNRTLPRGVGAQLAKVLKESPKLAGAVGRELLARPTEFALYVQAEQSPNPNSRITIAREKDALGVPFAQLDWRIATEDKVSLRRSQELLGRHLESVGLGHVVAEDWLVADDVTWSDRLIGGRHHLGTARMSASRTRGVVDADCRLHSVPNAFIIDGSVFPTGGLSNPLLTIVALALRAADTVKKTLGAQPEITPGR
jgi:choline dehydrogenase-like flavoprotein